MSPWSHQPPPLNGYTPMLCLRPWLAEFQHRESTFSYTEFCPRTGTWYLISQSLSQQCLKSTLDHYLSTCLLVAGHSLPWALPVLYSMTIWWACQSHCHPFNQSDESKNDKLPRQAHQDLESFSGKPQEVPFTWSSVRELQERGWNCLQSWFLLPHSEGENVAKHHQQSQNKDKYRERFEPLDSILPEASSSSFLPSAVTQYQPVG